MKGTRISSIDNTIKDNKVGYGLKKAPKLTSLSYSREIAKRISTVVEMCDDRVSANMALLLSGSTVCYVQQNRIPRITD